MKVKFIYGLSLLLLLVAFSSSAKAETLRLSVAGSLIDAVKELIAKYQQQHPDVSLLANYASSGSLAKQIVAGAPADIYISANPKWMKYLQGQGMIAPDAAQILVHNSLVFVGQTTTVAKSLADLPKLQKLALGSPKSVPAGRYAEQALIAAGIYPKLQAEHKLILAKDVRQALLYADRGEVDGAFVYRTDALLARQAKILFSVPQQLYPQIAYPAAVTKGSVGNAATAQLFNYLLSEQAQKIFTKYGFQIPE